VGGQEGAAQSVGQQLAAEVFFEIVLAPGADVVEQAGQARALAAAGEDGGAVDGPAAQVPVAAFADGAVAFEGQAEGVEALVAGGAAAVGAVALEGLAEREVAELRLV